MMYSRGFSLLGAVLRLAGRAAISGARTVLRGNPLVPRVSICAWLLTLMAWPTIALAQIEVPKWSVYEINLAASGSAANWYTDSKANVTTTFNGPGGATQIVTGFWDGGKSFKVRFTPTAEGMWTYQTSSSNVGLNGKTGRFSCVVPRRGVHGFLRVDALHAYSFVWDDGTRYFMWGQSYYDVLQPALVNGNWKTSVDQSFAYGMNKIRMQVYAQGYYEPNVEFSKYPDAQPYEGTSDNPDRDRLNIPYWRKLDEMVQYMGSKGMVADLIIANPYRNNRQFGTAEQNDRFVRYIVARYAAYPNVIWCVANEWDLSADDDRYQGPYRQMKADFDRMGALVGKGDPWMADGALRRPLSIHSGTTITFGFFRSAWPTYAIIQYGGWNPDYTNGDQWGNAGVAHNLGHGIPVVNDEYGYMGQTNPKPRIRVNMTRTRLREAIWGIATAGGYGSAGDFRVTPDGMGNVEITGDWYDAPEEYGDLKRLIDFFTTKGIQYWIMSARNDLLATGTRTYVLAETGHQYVIYSAIGGSVSLNLAEGSYSAWRYDPTDGTETSLGAVTGGSVQTFSLPAGHDEVVLLLLKR